MRISDWSSDVCSSDLVHDGVAAIETERVFQFVKPFARHFVAAVDQPAIGLKENGRTKKLVRIPPIAWATRRTAGAQNAFIEAVKLRPVFRRLQALLARRRRRHGLDPKIGRAHV